MERPSHIIFSTSHMSRRLPLFALAAFLQVGAVTLIMTGLGHFTPIIIPDFKLVAVKEPTIDRMPPPEPRIAKHIPTVPIPIVDNFDWDHGDHTITTQTRTATVDQPPKPQPPVPDRATVGITATHTQPSYPPIAIRQSLQGTVLLRLTVLETGRIGKVEVVTSSGSDILDQAARTWIAAHWTYKPATSGGQPVASQAMASVTFNLKDAR